MADHYSLCLLGVMDRLWFHQIILFKSSSSSSCLINNLPKTLKHQTPLITSSLINLPSTALSLSTQELEDDEEQEQEISSPTSPLSYDEISSSLELNKDYYLNYKEDGEDKICKDKERPTRLNLTTKRARSQSSSPLTTKRFNKNNEMRKKLQKSLSCRSLGELELEEVKGFMDLGFIFKKEQINPRIISVLPGLSRLGLFDHNQTQENSDIHNDENKIITKQENEEQKGEIVRPYLSEAWLIRRPDSPLLNLRLPRVYAAADMKKHLKSWARTVASEIHQES